MSPGVRLADVRPGDLLVADDGFTCIPAGPVRIYADAEGAYFRCGTGVCRHYLDSQQGDDGYLVGLSRAGTA